MKEEPLLGQGDENEFNFKISDQKSGRKVGTFSVTKGEKSPKGLRINSNSHKSSSSKSSGNARLLVNDTDNSRN